MFKQQQKKDDDGEMWKVTCQLAIPWPKNIMTSFVKGRKLKGWPFLWYLILYSKHTKQSLKTGLITSFGSNLILLVAFYTLTLSVFLMATCSLTFGPGLGLDGTRPVKGSAVLFHLVLYKCRRNYGQNGAKHIGHHKIVPSPNTHDTLLPLGFSNNTCNIDGC